MLYRWLLRPLLFLLPAETAHHAAFGALRLACAIPGVTALLRALLRPRDPALRVETLGLGFDSPVGLAAGFDKNAEGHDALLALGFGFVEVGTLTAAAQPGNPEPRMFRLSADRALINRLGFNNGGVDAFVANVARSEYRGVLGVNIGKNFDTPNERAADDYATCLRAVYPHATYVTVNVSSPNTKGLRDLQAEEALAALLARLKDEQAALAQAHGRYVPLAIKIAPDLTDAAVRSVARLLALHRIDGVVATNTTVARDAVAGEPHAEETGGLSGAPLRARSTEVVRVLAAALDGALPIVGVGGIVSGEDAREKVAAGASLVQLYTGLIYRGPALVGEAARACRGFAG